MNLLLLGPPGAGKGTQAKQICSALGIPHIGTGDMLRAAIASDSPLGHQVTSIIERGHLVPDETIARLVEARLSEPDAREGFLLDGFPRTLGQVALLDGILGTKRIDAVLMLVIPESVAIERLVGRGAEVGSTRMDDKIETIRERMRVYEAETKPVADAYEERGILAKIDGTGTISDVFARLQASIGRVRS